MLKFKNFSLFLFFPEGTCPKLEAPTNGRKLGKSYGVGHEVHFLCDPGYEVVGSESRTCHESLVWSGQLTACRGNGLASVAPPLHLPADTVSPSAHSLALHRQRYLPANHLGTLRPLCMVVSQCSQSSSSRVHSTKVFLCVSECGRFWTFLQLRLCFFFSDCLR